MKTWFLHGDLKTHLKGVQNSGLLFFRVPDREILKKVLGNFSWARDKDDRQCGDKQAGVEPTLVATVRGLDQWSLLKLLSVQLVS